MTHYPERPLSGVALDLNRIVKERPGIHFRELGRAAGLSSVGQLRHHLDRLERAGAVVEIGDGRFKRFFAAGEHEPRLRQGLARFSRRVPRLIAQLLLTRPMNRTELRRSLGCADSTLGYHLIRMRALGDLERNRGRNCCVYSLTNPDFVRRMLLDKRSPEAVVAPTLSQAERAIAVSHPPLPLSPLHTPLAAPALADAAAMVTQGASLSQVERAMAQRPYLDAQPTPPTPNEGSVAAPPEEGFLTVQHGGRREHAQNTGVTAT